MARLGKGHLRGSGPVAAWEAQNVARAAKGRADPRGRCEVSIWPHWGDGRWDACLRDQPLRVGSTEVIARFACPAQIELDPRQNVRMPQVT